jgi:hypothetical protein
MTAPFRLSLFRQLALNQFRYQVDQMVFLGDGKALPEAGIWIRIHLA